MSPGSEHPVTIYLNPAALPRILVLCDAILSGQQGFQIFQSWSLSGKGSHPCCEPNFSSSRCDLTADTHIYRRIGFCPHHFVQIIYSPKVPHVGLNIPWYESFQQIWRMSAITLTPYMHGIYQNPCHIRIGILAYTQSNL